MKNFRLSIYILFSSALVNSLLMADEQSSQRDLKNKIYNFSSKNIDENMLTKWKLTGLFLEKYDDNYTFIKNPKLKVF